MGLSGLNATAVAHLAAAISDYTVARPGHPGRGCPPTYPISGPSPPVSRRRSEGFLPGVGRYFPEPRRVILAPGHESLAVGAEGDGADPPLVPIGRADGLAGVCIPELRRSVSLPVTTLLPLGRSNATALTGPPCRRGLPMRPSGGRVPEPRRAILAAGENGLPVGAEGDGLDRAIVLQEIGDGISGGCVPDLRTAFILTVIAPGEDGLPVGAKATAQTGPSCSKKTVMGSPEVASQTRALPLSLP